MKPALIATNQSTSKGIHPAFSPKEKSSVISSNEIKSFFPSKEEKFSDEYILDLISRQPEGVCEKQKQKWESASARGDNNPFKYERYLLRMRALDLLNFKDDADLFDTSNIISGDVKKEQKFFRF